MHHTTSPALESMLDAVLAGTRAEGIEGVDVVVRPALGATASDVLAARAVVLGTPANIGYMSGALKHFFDQIYYPCLEDTVGRPFAAFLHGNDDLTGGLVALEKITTGLRWRRVQPVLGVTGAPSLDDLAACRELGAVTAATAAGLLG